MMMSATSPIRPSASTAPGTESLPVHFAAEEGFEQDPGLVERERLSGLGDRHRIRKTAGFQGEADAMLRLQPLGEVTDHMQQHLVAIGNQQGPLQASSSSRAATRSVRLGANCRRDVDQVGFMRFEETKERRKQGRLRCPPIQLVCFNSGQVQEPLGAAFVRQCGGKRGERQRLSVICRASSHGLSRRRESGGRIRLAKILIVEDNALNIKLFCDLLAAHGHEPQAVTDSRLALDAAREFVPDLVITDIQLPHVSGLELIYLIRADSGLKNVPIMAVTAYATAGDEEESAGRGLNRT